MLNEIIWAVVFPTELLTASCLCASPHRKRSHWPLRTGISLLSGILFMYLMSKLFSKAAIPYDSVLFLGTFFVIWLGICFSYRVSPAGGIYVCILGYAVQHFASSAYILLFEMLFHRQPYSLSSPAELSVYLVVYTVSYAGLYMMLIRKIPSRRGYQASTGLSIQGFLVVIPITIWLSLLSKRYMTNFNQIAVTQVYAMVCCLLVLWIQYWQNRTVVLRMDAAMSERVMEERRRQFAQSVANMDVINQKCHDLKYQIQALKNNAAVSAGGESAIDEVMDAVHLYDDFFQTGNEILDTVLMEKSIACRRYNIYFTAIADGSRLTFMAPMDLYVMMGNALDNAIEASRQIKDIRRRVISLSLKAKGDLTILQVENTFEGEILFDEDGMPLTGKKNKAYHGFGVKSIRSIAASYGGTMKLAAEDQQFLLTLLFAEQEVKTQDTQIG